MFFGAGLDGTIWGFQSMHILTPNSLPPAPTPPHKSQSIVQLECICGGEVEGLAAGANGVGGPG